MKRWIALLTAMVLMLSFGTALAAVKDDIAVGAALSQEELVDKAKAESGTFVVYGNTSRIATALEGFTAVYGIQGEASNLKDAEIYTKLEIEIDGNAKGADMVMIQDGASLLYMTENEYLYSFVPAALQETVAEKDRDPLVHQYINKLFIYNNKGEEVPAIKNVWELTDEKLKGNILFKNPESEQVNMNFLVMLTGEEWSAKLAEAYKAYAGKDIELGEYKNAGYKWIAEFLQNCTFGSSDTTIAEELSQETAQGKIGLFVLSKLRSSSVLTENLTVAQYEATKDGQPVMPFSGFMYPMYALVSANAQRPYTAMLFIDYLMSKDGFAPWGKSVGAYSSNVQLAPAEDDLGLDVWKETLVMEDPQWILNQYEDVSTFVTKYIQ